MPATDTRRIIEDTPVVRSFNLMRELGRKLRRPRGRRPARFVQPTSLCWCRWLVCSPFVVRDLGNFSGRPVISATKLGGIDDYGLEMALVIFNVGIW